MEVADRLLRVLFVLQLKHQVHGVQKQIRTANS